VDAIGNRIESWRQDDDPNAADPGTARVLAYIAGGALSYVTASNNDSTAGRYYRDNRNYDGTGNETATGTASRHDLYSALTFAQRVSYYDAAGRLRESERHLGGYSQSSADTQDDYGSYEEYRYDALGRRVFVVALGNGGRFTEQTLWDGDQMLYQRREQYPNTTAGAGGYTGEVGYVTVPEVLGTDRPVAVWSSRMSGIITPHVDWRGAYAFGTRGTGATDCCTGFVWPAAAMTVDHMTPHQSGMVTWLGGLLQEGKDGSALQYKRNRYYDPGSGRFTQVDPIGLAGGLNAYGFAGGDPVSYSDPFGLCPTDAGGDGKTKTLADCPIGSPGRRQYASGAIESSSFDPAFFFGGIEAKGAEEMASGAARLISRISESPALRRIASKLEGEVQSSIDHLTAQLAKGNMNPGIGSRFLFNGIFAARARDGARVYFRNLGKEGIEVLAKSTKQTQDQVIRVLQELYR
jgi:RHS repeat-associated protein